MEPLCVRHARKLLEVHELGMQMQKSSTNFHHTLTESVATIKESNQSGLTPAIEKLREKAHTELDVIFDLSVKCMSAIKELAALSKEIEGG